MYAYWLAYKSSLYKNIIQGMRDGPLLSRGLCSSNTNIRYMYVRVGSNYVVDA